MQEFLAFAHQLADAAGEVVTPYFGKRLVVETKGDQSPVSRADREAEAAMRALIETRYPEHGIYGEETDPHAIDREFVWVLDPIDGTRAFLAGKKEWGTLVALCHRGIPIIGILSQPVTGERWVGMADAPTIFINGPNQRRDALLDRMHADIQMPLMAGIAEKQIHTTPCPRLAEARISTTSRNYFTPPQAVQFAALADACAEAIENGDCYAYGLLARGDRDLVADAGLKPYDILALVPIIEGAGGKITDWDGAPPLLGNCSNILASGDIGLHAEALKFLTH